MSRSGPDGLHVPEKEATVSNILQIIRYPTSLKTCFQNVLCMILLYLTPLFPLLRSCNRSLEAEDPDDVSTSPSSTGPSPASRNNSFRDRCRNQSVPFLFELCIHFFPPIFCLPKSSSGTKQEALDLIRNATSELDRCMFSVAGSWTRPAEEWSLSVGGCYASCGLS